MHPQGEAAFDVGVSAVRTTLYGGEDGSGHETATTSGLNLEATVGLGAGLELGLRTGARFDEVGRQATYDSIPGPGADYYARLWDTDTYGAGYGTVANPELRLRFAALDQPRLGAGVEARLYVPLAEGSYGGLMAGVPVTLRLPEASMRVDTGLFVPVFFGNDESLTPRHDRRDETVVALSVPLRVWFQATERLWLGLKAQALLRDVARNKEGADLGATSDAGVGLGVQVRLE